MKIKYTGTPGEPHESIAMYGINFVKGKYVEVKDYLAQRKLSRHPHFEVSPADQDKIEDGKIILPQTIPDVTNTLVVSDGTSRVTKAELAGLQSDPMVQESGVTPTYDSVLDAKTATK